MDSIKKLQSQFAIIGLKAQQLRAVDTKSWPDLKALITEDFELIIAHEDEEKKCSGSTAAIKQIQDSVCNSTTIHQAHTPDFSFASNGCQVIWSMHNRIINHSTSSAFNLFGFHTDIWVKTNGGWRLSNLRADTHYMEIDRVSSN